MFCDNLKLLTDAFHKSPDGGGVEVVCSTCRTVLPPTATVVVDRGGRLFCFRDAFRIVHAEIPLLTQQEFRDTLVPRPMWPIPKIFHVP